MSAGESAQNDAIAQRLQAKDTALRNLTKKWLSFTNAIENSSLEECESLHKSLSFDIAQYEFTVGKANALIDTNVRQVAEYDRMQQSVETEMYAIMHVIKLLVLSFVFPSCTCVLGVRLHQVEYTRRHRAAHEGARTGTHDP